jgi:hypothetical protein
MEASTLLFRVFEYVGWRLPFRVALPLQAGLALGQTVAVLPCAQVCGCSHASCRPGGSASIAHGSTGPSALGTWLGSRTPHCWARAPL